MNTEDHKLIETIANTLGASLYAVPPTEAEARRRKAVAAMIELQCWHGFVARN